jgi:uncharacterized membrane protein required for colicin V production
VLGRFTLLDWLILALPLLLVLRGLLKGGVAVLFSGFARLLLSIALAPLALAYAAGRQGASLEALAAKLGVPAVAIPWAVGLIVVLVVYVILGFIGRSLSGLLNATTVGRAVDRLLGLPAGLLVGAWLALLVVVGPGLQARALLAPESQPAVLRDSVLLPIAEQYWRRVMDPVLRRTFQQRA